MTTLTPDCHECKGKGWVMRSNGWPTECEACTPTKLARGRLVVDQGRVTALTERRKQTPRPRLQRPTLFDSSTILEG